MTFQFMPFRGEEGAPAFDRSQPVSLHRYFTHIKELFTRYGIADDLEKKAYTTSFLECDLSDQWEALVEFSAKSDTYSGPDLYNLPIPCYTLLELEQLVFDQFHSASSNHKTQVLALPTEQHLGACSAHTTSSSVLKEM